MGVDRVEAPGREGRPAAHTPVEVLTPHSVEEPSPVEHVDVPALRRRLPNEEVPGHPDADEVHTTAPADLEREDRERDGQAPAPVEHGVEVAVHRRSVVTPITDETLLFEQHETECGEITTGLAHPSTEFVEAHEGALDVTGPPWHRTEQGGRLVEGHRFRRTGDEPGEPPDDRIGRGTRRMVSGHGTTLGRRAVASRCAVSPDPWYRGRRLSVHVMSWLDHDGPVAHAHRGGSAERAENSVEAFEHAVRLGYRYVETDVRRTRDDRLVVWHDVTLDRTTDHRGPVAEVAWADLARFGLRPPAGAGDAHRPLLLEDLLGSWPGLRVTIDAKEDAVVDLLCDVVRRCAALDRVCIGAFSPARLREVRRRLGPQACTATGPTEVARIRFGSLGVPLRRPTGPQTALVPVRHRGVPVVDRRFVARAQAWGLGVHVWTVDDATSMHRLLDLGVTGLMTDHPTLLRDVLIERGAWSGPRPGAAGHAG